MPPEKVDTVVIGAGVIGLAVARAMAIEGREVLVLEANPATGQEISSRNSEVIHAGIYYPPGSLKSNTCIAGRKLLYRYCQERNIPHKRPGKLIVATDGKQIGQLGKLKKNAETNGVTNLELISKEKLREIEPAVCAKAALLSPSTGIIDSHALMLALQADIETAGGTIVTNSRVTGGYTEHNGIQLQVVSGDESWLFAHRVINAAGLPASQVARSIPDVTDQWIPRTWFVKGQYFSYSGKSPFSHLVYPLPDEHGLGIHATLDQADQLRFGPDAWYCEMIDYSFDESSKEAFTNSIRRWFPAVDANLLQPGYTGIRPRLAGPGDDFADFAISGPAEHGVPGLVNLFGIESPGLTACLALADEVVARFH